MLITNQQSPFLAQSSVGIPHQQAFAGQGMQSGMKYSQSAPVSNAWSYRLQPTTSEMNTGMSQQAGIPQQQAGMSQQQAGISQQQAGIAQQPGGQQFIQHAQQPMNVSSAAMMQRQSTGFVSPDIDISETKNDLVVACNIPNANLNNLNLTATENSLSISAQAFVGNQATSVYRTIPLSTTVRAESVDANYSNGILQIRMPKKETSSRKQLQVNVGENQ